MNYGKICAIFGEDPTELEFGYDEEYYTCSCMKLRLVLAMQAARCGGCDCFVTTLEQGVAMWGAEACIAMREKDGDVSLFSVPTSENQASRWHPERRDRYYSILEASDEVLTLPSDTSAAEYILGVATHAIILGDSTLPRISSLICRAKELGVALVPVGKA